MILHYKYHQGKVVEALVVLMFYKFRPMAAPVSYNWMQQCSWCPTLSLYKIPYQYTYMVLVNWSFLIQSPGQGWNKWCWKISSSHATLNRISHYMGIAFTISPYVLLGSIAVLHFMKLISQSTCVVEQCSNLPCSPLGSTTATEERGWPAYHLEKVR